MVPVAFDPHLLVFQPVRVALLERGFSPGAWEEYPHTLADLPRPALFPSGDFGPVDLASQTATFPHNLRVKPFEAYVAMLDALQARTPGRGRPNTVYWRKFANELNTSVGSILTPMRCGYYNVARPQLAMAYHAAEFAYLLFRRFPEEASLTFEANTMYVELDGAIYGVVEGQVVHPEGRMIDPGHDFNPKLMMGLREAPGRMLPAPLTTWRAILAFMIERAPELYADMDFMQAAAHCRWALPGSFEWGDRPYKVRARGRPRRQSDPVQEQAMRIEGAFTLLERVPDITMRHIRQRLVPYVLSREEWGERVAPITRNKRRRRGEVIDYLKQLHAEVLQST
jgi:hypothetical protein